MLRSLERSTNRPRINLVSVVVLACLSGSLGACKKGVPQGGYMGTFGGMYSVVEGGKERHLPQSGTLDVTVDKSGGTFTLKFKECTLAGSGTSTGVQFIDQKCTLAIGGKGSTVIGNMNGSATYDGRGQLSLVLTGKGPETDGGGAWSMTFTGLKR